MSQGQYGSGGIPEGGPGAASDDGYTPEERRQIDASRRKLLRSMGLSLVLPLVLYYGLRHFGFSPLSALLIGCVPPVVKTLWTVVKERKVDALALFTLCLFLVGGLTSLITGSPRWILAKSGALTGVMGVGLLFTTHRVPAIFQGLKGLQPSADAAAKWQYLWDTYAPFKHIMRAANVIWGVGLILDGVVRGYLAYTLPIDQVPTASMVLVVASIVLIQLVSKRYGRLYMRRHGLRLRGSTIERIPAGA